MTNGNESTKSMWCGKSSLEESSQQCRPSSKKQEKFQIKNLIYHLRELEKEQTKPKTRGNKVINVREEINKRD